MFWKFIIYIPLFLTDVIYYYNNNNNNFFLNSEYIYITVDNSYHYSLLAIKHDHLFVINIISELIKINDLLLLSIVSPVKKSSSWYKGRKNDLTSHSQYSSTRILLLLDIDACPSVILNFDGDFLLILVQCSISFTVFNPIALSVNKPWIFSSLYGLF